MKLSSKKTTEEYFMFILSIELYSGDTEFQTSYWEGLKNPILVRHGQVSENRPTSN